MNDGNIGPDTLEAENQQEQEPEQESQYTIHQLPTMNNPDNFGFGDISPNTLEAEHQQEQEQNTSTQVSITKWFVKVHGMVHQIGTHQSCSWIPTGAI